MSYPNHYQTLQVSKQATQTEIKNAYRRLAKRFHPDSQGEKANHEQIVQLNAAYEVLKDSQSRRSYDLELFSSHASHSSTRRQQKSSKASSQYQRQRQTEREADALEQKWLKEVYQPIKKLVIVIIQPLETEIEELAADPFDDELMVSFQAYLQNSFEYLNQANQVFTSLPNPAKFAGVAANLYYCLDRLTDGLEELERFTLNYDAQYLNMGQELFTIATELYSEAINTALALT